MLLQNSLFLLSILSLGLVKIPLIKYEIVIYVVIIFFLSNFILSLVDIFNYKKIEVNASLLKFYVYIFITSLFGIATHNITGSFVSHYIGIIIFSFTYYYYFKNNLHEKSLFYIKILNVFSIIALIQEIGYLLNISFLYDYAFLGIDTSRLSMSGNFLRVTSLMKEPAHLSFLIAPVVYLSYIKITKFWKKEFYIGKLQSICNILVLLLTFSLIGYLILLMIILFELMKKGKIKSLIIGSFIVIFSFSIVMKIPVINRRVESIVNFNPSLLSNKDNSIFAVVSNLLIAKDAVLESKGIGNGLNSHQNTYDRNINNHFNNIYLELNKEDASSLYIRIISEFGIIGIILFLYFLYKNFEKKSDEKHYYLNQMAFIGIVGYGIRCGIYLHPVLWINLAIFLNLKKINKGVENEGTYDIS